MSKTQPARIGLLTTTALVVGNMIASGIYMLPVSLAHYGAISLLGWVASSIGAIFLALLFGRLSKLVKNSVGGPYAYTRAGFGEFAAFVVAWGYWISIWCTNAAITVAFVSYLGVFIPAINDNSGLAIFFGLVTVWFLTWVNTLGVKQAGRVQLVTTILKLAPLILIALVGCFYIQPDNFIPFNKSNVSDLSAITSTATLTLFAFLGLESATIPSRSVKNPETTIAKATIIGTAITILVYVLSSTVIMGIIPSKQLINSTAPFSDTAAIIWGNQARYWVGLAALISTFGALNGWILLQGQIPMAAANDKLFPAILARENSNGVPVFGIIISSVLVSLLLFLNFSESLGSAFTTLILLATVTSVISFLLSAGAYVLILSKNNSLRQSIMPTLIAVVAFFYSFWAIAGSGQESIYWGFLAILSGIPIYVWMKRS